MSQLVPSGPKLPLNVLMGLGVLGTSFVNVTILKLLGIGNANGYRLFGI